VPAGLSEYSFPEIIMMILIFFSWMMTATMLPYIIDADNQHAQERGGPEAAATGTTIGHSW
jgi:hypothetical protein